MFNEIFENVKTKGVLVHNITNYVTVNDCANIILAIGASPVMADEKEEVCEITSIANALNINIGTLNKNTIESMFLAAKKANELDKPVLLDPVGAGASKLRTNTARDLIANRKISVIRGNLSEIRAIIESESKTKGVDADIEDAINYDNLEERVAFAKECARKTKAIIAITGQIDIVANDKKAYCIYNGVKEMSRITGTGCQLSAMTAAFIAANIDNQLEAVAVSVMTMGLAGEIAFKRLSDLDGNASFRNYVIDAVYNMTPEMLKEGARYEVR